MAENTNILAGVGAIVNPQNVKTGVNVDELAKSLINDGLISDTRALQSEEDPAEKFNAELAHAAKKLGIEFEDIEPSSRGTSTKKKPSISFLAGTDSSSALSRGREDDYGGGREASSSSDDDADGEDVRKIFITLVMKMLRIVKILLTRCLFIDRLVVAINLLSRAGEIPRVTSTSTLRNRFAGST